jgi:hypothetical protein
MIDVDRGGLMETIQRKRPAFATVICILTALLAAHTVYRMLLGHHSVLRQEIIEAQSHAERFIHITALIDMILEVGGIIALWLMRPIAATLYAVQIVTDGYQISRRCGRLGIPVHGANCSGGNSGFALPICMARNLPAPETSR